MPKNENKIRNNENLQARIEELEVQGRQFKEQIHRLVDAESQLKILNSTLKTIRNVNQCINREKDENKLLLDTCRIITENPHFQCAWIAKVSLDNKPVKIQQVGYGANFHDFLATWNKGRLPVCIDTLIKGKKNITIEDPLVTCSECTLLSHDSPLKVTCLRLEANNYLYGSLVVCHTSIFPVGGEEQSLLKELAGDISFALYALDLEREQKHLEQQLARSEQRFRSIFTRASIGISLTRPDGSIPEINAALAEMLGYSVEELQASNFAAITYPDDVAASKEYMRSLFAGEKDKCEFDKRYNHKNGNVVWGHVNTVLLRDPEGNPLHLITTVQDITDRKRAEEALQKSEERYRMTLDHMIEGAQVIGRDWRYIYMNDAAAGHGHKIREELIGRTMMEVYPGIEKTEMFAVLRKCLEQRVHHLMENEFIYQDGSKGWFELSIQPVPEGVFVLSLDITARKRAEEALRASEEKLRSILLSSPNAITVTDLNGIIVECNRKASVLHNYSSIEDMIGKNALVLIAPRDHYRAVDNLKKTLEQGLLENVEYTLLTKDGREFPGELSASVIKDSANKPVCFIAITKDITERKRTEEELKLRNILLSTQQETTLDGILVVDDNSNILSFNQRFVDMWGIPSDMIRTRSDQLVLKAVLGKVVDPDQFLERVEYLYTNKSVAGQDEIFLKDGRTIERYSAPLNGSDAKYYGRVWYFRDITERKQAEEALRTSETQLSNALKIAHMGPWEYDVAKDIFTFNEHFYRIFRTTALEEGGYTMSSARYAKRFVHPDDISMVGLEIQKAVETTDPHFSRQLEHRINYSTGEIGYISVSFFVVKDEQGRTVKTYGVNQDITERKKAEEALRKSEQKFRSFIEQSAEALVLTDEQGKVILWNQAAEQTFGLKRSEVIGKELWDTQYNFVIDSMKTPQYYEALKSNTLNVLETGQGSWVNNIKEMEIRLPTGELAIIETRAFIIQTEKGFLLGSVNRNVTEHRRSEELLNKRLIYERMLAEISAQALLISNSENFLEKSMEILGKTLDITRVSINNNSQDSKVLRLLKEWVDPRYISAEFHLREISPNGSLWIAEQMARNQVKLFVDSGNNLVDVPAAIPTAPNVKTMLVVPLFVDQEYFGFIGFEDAQRDRIWKGEDIDILRTTATIIAQTISRNKYKEQLEEIVLNRTKELQNTVEQLEKVIQERQSVQEELLEAKISAETANRAKSEFLANMSHELRTPLNAITGFSQILQDGIIAPVNPEQQEVLGNILESSNHLLILINEILDLSKIEAGKVEIKRSTFLLAPFLEHCRNLFGEKAAEKNIHLGIDVNNDLSTIVADEVKLKQVVFNLLSNAVKYTLIGGDAGVIAKQVGDVIQITVWDTGIGIAPENLPKLFQPFGRIETDYSKGFSGTGLGLHYSKKLVELHGGTIWVESEEGKGSRFHFTIPQSDSPTST